ncbi:hypothetical protein [Streptomyces marianii]|uniref:Lipoprotein n=1 Tax=Streptomyces marianii TaxID=1817406 RepID=A0A5R9E1U2_9ACTN|nr:hypothetical protein [Streptomyces marianii]TLQ43357.1 hypothetical protein FEF34_09590 [Streptomyces marianii]
MSRSIAVLAVVAGLVTGCAKGDKGTTPTESGQGCDVYYTISETAELAPEKDRKVDGKQTTAVRVSAGAAEDTYFIENGASHLLLLESSRDGRTSTTTYDSFGDKFPITLPPKEKTMSMSEFRSQIMGG